MDSNSIQPLTVSEAKYNLLNATVQSELTELVQGNPLVSVGAAFLAGVVAGRLNRETITVNNVLGIAQQILKQM